jgi:hypothetical protein
MQYNRAGKSESPLAKIYFQLISGKKLRIKFLTDSSDVARFQANLRVYVSRQRKNLEALGMENMSETHYVKVVLLDDTSSEEYSIWQVSYEQREETPVYFKVLEDDEPTAESKSDSDTRIS